MSTSLNEILRLATQLPQDQQLKLISQLAHQLHSAVAQPQQEKASGQRLSKTKWADLKGMATYPMMGEEAQSWVTRTRQEGASHREQLLNGE